jgi:hypothetical protein
MTLNDIIVSALAQLDRGHDSQTVDTWRDKLTRYANEAVIDLATILQLRRTDTLEVEGGVADIALLPRCCVKVLYIARNMSRSPFIAGSSGTELRALCADGPVQVPYMYPAQRPSSPTDVPELPPTANGMIVTYVVARERASADPPCSARATLFFAVQRGQAQPARHGGRAGSVPRS